MKKYGALILGLALSWQSVEAKTVLISDIDDTIKNSHILDTSETIRSPLLVANLVRGMNQAYDLLLKNNKDLTGLDTIPVYYVTNAPEKLMDWSHSWFLGWNNFPTGTLKLRESLREKEHKLKAIRAIIAQENPTHLIMVGDNGEKDIPIYDQIRKEFPNIEYSMHIRMAYYTKSSEEPGVALMNDQEGFATAFDLVLSWVNKGFIEAESVVDFVNKFGSELGKEKIDGEVGSLALPEWMDCRDLTFSTGSLEKIPREAQQAAYKALAKITYRCSIPGSEGN